MPAIIETTGLVMQFASTRALESLDLRVPSGVTGLVGANGAGKTTLISITLGLLKPTSGSIKVLGLDPSSNGPELRARIGYGPERNVLPDDMRAYDFVRHFAQIKGLPRDEARSRASDSLYLVGLGEERFRALGTMSTGQRQRVKLAQAIAADPSFIVLDEPTDGLDPVQRDEMLSIIVDVNRKFGIDVMLSSHV
ncbi:MAG: ABC-2 type transport system ATP-binding protein, partial [Ilumatobacter sp.]